MLYQFFFLCNKTIEEMKKMISSFFLTFIYLFIYFVLPKQFQVIFSSKPNKYACSKYVCRHYASALLVQKAKELLTSHVHSPHKNNFFLEKKKEKKIKKRKRMK